jgi:hypothetical protein
VPTYRLAQGTLEPGLFSDHGPVMQDFYLSKVGLPFVEDLPHSPTYRELHFGLPGGKLKIQASTEPMALAVTGYTEVLIARDGLAAVQTLTDPDGLAVTLTPPGHRGVTHNGVTCAVPDVDAHRRFLIEGMGATDHAGGLRVGDTQLFVTEAPAPGPVTPPMRRGFTYLTLIVDDCAAAHEALLAAGAEHSLRILRLADRCNFSWVRDPSGNWVEMVQYARLSGPLPPVDRLEDHWDEVERWREDAVSY